MSVVGFDFGNSKSVVAVARKRGIDVLQNEVGNRATPSMVAFGSSKQRLIGNEAASQMMSNAANTINHIKVLVGRAFDDPSLANETLYYKLTADARGNAAVDVQYDDKRETLSVEQLIGALFQKLKATASAGLDNMTISDCVISCPPWWTDKQRHVLLDGANIAGLNVLRLMNETTAVALNYGILRPLAKDKEIKVLFVDVGHCTSTATLVSFTEGKLHVLATASDAQLGGRNFDDLLVRHFAEYIKTQYKMDVTTDRKAMMKLRKECERVKLNLSANSMVQFNVEYIMNDRDVSGKIERAEFEAMLQKEAMPRLTALIERVMVQANATKEDLFNVEIIGGSVRIPAIQKALADYFGRDMSKTCDGDESVARGCALMCAMISPSFRVKEFEVHDLSPYSVVLEWGPVTATGTMIPDDSTPLFTVNNPIPSVKLVSFNDRVEPFQLIARYRDEGSLPPYTKPIIGRFVISGMPPKSATEKAPKIKVRVKLNAHGVLQVAGAQAVEEVVEEAAAGAGAAAAKPADEAMTDAPAAGAAAAATAGKEDVPMDGNAAAAAGAAGAAGADKPATKKVKKEDLKVESFTSALDSTALNALFERETAMHHQDRLVFETNEARNTLESYALEMRSKLSDELSEYATSEAKEALVEMLQQAEDWLYGDGFDAQKSEYKQRLETLQKHGDPIAKRRFEADHRAEFVERLEATLKQYSEWVQTIDERYAHIGDDERVKIVNEIVRLRSWIETSLQAASTQPKVLDPPITVAEITRAREQFERFVLPIVNRPKPAPAPAPKPEEKKPEAAAAADAAGAAAGASAAAADAAGAGAAAADVKMDNA